MHVTRRAKLPRPLHRDRRADTSLAPHGPVVWRPPVISRIQAAGRLRHAGLAGIGCVQDRAGDRGRPLRLLGPLAEIRAHFRCSCCRRRPAGRRPRGFVHPACVHRDGRADGESCPVLNCPGDGLRHSPYVTGWVVGAGDFRRPCFRCPGPTRAFFSSLIPRISRGPAVALGPIPAPFSGVTFLTSPVPRDDDLRPGGVAFFGASGAWDSRPP